MTDGTSPPDLPHFHGHRQRLRNRFLAEGAATWPDYELLELLLFQSVPRIDTKPLAKRLLAHFGSFAALLTASPHALKTAGVSESTIAQFKIVTAAAQRLALAELGDQPVLSCWEKVVAYCRTEMAHQPREQLRLLFLDKKNRLIRAEQQQDGTVDQAPVYPREVARRALELDASAVIMAHNHPSGDPSPSQADITVTRQVQQALAALGIALHDHLVIGRHGECSFRALGLL